jgi:hypothetical protein
MQALDYYICTNFYTRTRRGKDSTQCSAIITLNILHIPLACTSYLSSMPMILKFELLMESLSSCIFLSHLLSCLTKISSVFITILSLSSEILSATCSSMLEWLSSMFFYLTKGIFISWISVSFFFLRFSISLFNSSFISCVILFILYIFFYSLLFFTSVSVEVFSVFI